MSDRSSDLKESNVTNAEFAAQQDTMAAIEGELFGILMFTLGGLLWLLVPFIDRGTPDGRQSRWLFRVGVVIVIYIVAFTLKGYFL